MCGAVPIQDFPRPIVEHRLHPLNLAAGQLIESRPFGKELAQQPTGVLVCASFPRTMRNRKGFQEPLIAFQTCSSLVCGGCCWISTLLCGRSGCDYRSLGAQVPTVTGKKLWRQGMDSELPFPRRGLA
jgi:hypothetical protein